MNPLRGDGGGDTPPPRLRAGPAVLAEPFSDVLGTRRSETLNLRWSDVGEHAKTWTVPGMFRKGGRTHVVPLPPLALAFLKDLRPVGGDAP